MRDRHAVRVLAEGVEFVLVAADDLADDRVEEGVEGGAGIFVCAVEVCAVVEQFPGAGVVFAHAETNVQRSSDLR